MTHPAKKRGSRAARRARKAAHATAALPLQQGTHALAELVRQVGASAAGAESSARAAEDHARGASGALAHATPHGAAALRVAHALQAFFQQARVHATNAQLAAGPDAPPALQELAHALAELTREAAPAAEALAAELRSLDGHASRALRDAQDAVAEAARARAHAATLTRALDTELPRVRALVRSCGALGDARGALEDG